MLILSFYYEKSTVNSESARANVLYFDVKRRAFATSTKCAVSSGSGAWGKGTLFVECRESGIFDSFHNTNSVQRIIARL